MFKVLLRVCKWLLGDLKPLGLVILFSFAAVQSQTPTVITRPEAPPLLLSGSLLQHVLSYN